MIDDGMRSGIPREDWGSVVTLYGDAARPVASSPATGTCATAASWIDAEGRVAWFWDQGFSA